MKLFISHAHEDKELAEALLNFITTGIGLDNSQIFFSSSSSGHGVPLGFNFNDYIQKELQNHKVQVIALITNNYFNNRYCLYELGASWGLTRTIIPVLGPRMNHAMMDNFLASTKAVSITREEDVSALVDDLKQKFSTKDVPVQNLFNSRREFVKKVKLIDSQSSVIRNSIKINNNFLDKNYKYKVVAFDFDGPLLQSKDPLFGDTFHYSWKEVWKFLGYDDKIRKNLYYRHKNDPVAYPYQEWCNDCASHFIEKKLNKRHIKEIITKENLKLAEGLKTTLIALKHAGMELAIISGGIDTFFEETFDYSLKSLFKKVFFNKFEWDSEGYLKGIKAYQTKESDFRGKVDALKEVCRISNCDISQAVFVGEGTNDIDAARSGCLSIAYPPTATQDFKDIADVVTSDFNIATILSHILVPNKQNPKKMNYHRKNK